MTTFYSIYSSGESLFSVCKETVSGQLASYGPFSSHAEALEYIEVRKTLDKLRINTKEIIDEYKKFVQFRSKHDKRTNWH